MIKVKNINFSYNTKDLEIKEEVLRDLTLTIEKNKHTCILGHNGSGKSTLAKLLIGLDFAESGEIEIDGIRLNEKNIYEIRQLVGIVFQNPDNQFIGSTVADDIAFGLENHCIPHEDMEGIVNKYAAKVGMSDYLKQEPTRLSGGQKQRVAIAGILAMNPKIMIFDEATSMLDPNGVIEVNESIEMLKKTKDKTIITITHDIDYAMNADHVIVLNQGQLLLEGKPNEVFKNYEILKETNLDIPFTLKIVNRLKDDGFKVNDIYSMEELESFLCQ